MLIDYMATGPSKHQPNKNRAMPNDKGGNTPEMEKSSKDRQSRLSQHKYTAAQAMEYGRNRVLTLADGKSRKLFNYLRHWKDEEAQTVLCELLRVSGWEVKGLECTWPNPKKASDLKQSGHVPINAIGSKPVEQWMLQRATGLMLADCNLGGRTATNQWTEYDPNKHKHLHDKGMVELAWDKKNRIIVVPSVAGAMTVLDLMDEGYYFIHRRTNKVSKKKAKELRKAHQKTPAERRAERINARLERLGKTTE